jgi:hypothetical protein
MDSKKANQNSPEIALVINAEGVKGAICLGESSSIRQKAYALLSLLEPDLIEIRNLLNDRIQEKVHSSNSICDGC